jgi:hypothetical protein
LLEEKQKLEKAKKELKSIEEQQKDLKRSEKTDKLVRALERTDDQAKHSAPLSLSPPSPLPSPQRRCACSWRGTCPPLFQPPFFSTAYGLYAIGRLP